MHVHHEVLYVLCLGLSVVVVAQQFSHLSLFGLLQGDIVWVAAKNVLELTLQLVDIIVVLSCKVEFDFFILDDCSSFLFCLLVELLFQVVNDAIVMMAVLLPELTQLFC